MKTLAIIEDQVTELGLADAHGVCQHSLEHRFQLTGRTADDAEDLGGRGLLLQRLGEFARALLFGLEQSDIFDGNDGLVGEGLDERNLLVREWPYLRAAHLQDTDGDTLAH